MAKDNPLASKELICPEDLIEEPIIHTRRDSVFFRDLASAFAERHVDLNSWIETRQFTAACMIVAEGKGVSIVSELDAEGHTDRGIVFRPFKPDISHVLSLVRPMHSTPSMLTLEFMDFFTRSLSPFRVD